MTKVLILAGGQSDEREVSLRSGKAVYDALLTAGAYEVELVDYHSHSTNDEILRTADVVFPALHGPGGEDGVLQARLEGLGLRFVGSDATSSSLCMDKWRYKQYLQDSLPVMAGELVARSDIWQSPLTRQPFVIKPHDGGSSIDTIIVRDIVTLDRQAVEALFERHETMLVEEYVAGIEVTAAVVGHQALPIVEIIPPADGEFDYENKYNGQTQELCPPVNVSPLLQERVQALALQAHKLCGCRDMSRTDAIIANDGSVYIIETNTIPGLTDQSLLPREALAAGISMPQLCRQLVEAALQR